MLDAISFLCALDPMVGFPREEVERKEGEEGDERVVERILWFCVVGPTQLRLTRLQSRNAQLEEMKAVIAEDRNLRDKAYQGD